jgi:hypothetical protein
MGCAAVFKFTRETAYQQLDLLRFEPIFSVMNIQLLQFYYRSIPARPVSASWRVCDTAPLR